jgi:nitrogen regulatory protein PII
MEMLPKLHLEITAPDGEAERLAQALWTVASTAQAADGEMCFYEVEDQRKRKDGKCEGAVFPGEPLFTAPGIEIDARRTVC